MKIFSNLFKRDMKQQETIKRGVIKSEIRIERTSCCGMRVVDRIQSEHSKNPLDVLYKIYYDRITYSSVVFTTNGGRGSVNVKKLKKVIDDNDLGEFYSSPKNLNPNSGKKIQVHVWTIKRRNFRKFIESILD